MQELKEKISDIYKIIQRCEQSELSSFEYKDSKISIQFHKNGKQDTYYKDYLTKSNGEVFASELESNSIKYDFDEITLASELQTRSKENEEVEEDDVVTIISPFVGTIEFSNQIKLNSGEIKINKGDVICSIEAMKLYNDIKSSVTGTIVQILVEDSSLVEFEQPIIKVRVDKNE